MKRILGFMIVISVMTSYPDRGEAKKTKPISNFGQVSDHLYRGGRLRSEDQYAQLSALGIDTIISLERFHSEEDRLCEEYHLSCVRFPLVLLPLPDADRFFDYELFKEAFKFLNKEIEDGKDVYFHCYYGKDRTGSLASAFRIRTLACGHPYNADELWATVEAELDQYGFHTDLYPTLKKNIRSWVYELPAWVCEPTSH